VQCEAGRGTVGELQRRFVDAFECAFGDEANAVDEGVTSHAAILQEGQISIFSRQPATVQEGSDLDLFTSACHSEKIEI
jgi:hypothetical protein